jgi:hypothetical protein
MLLPTPRFEVLLDPLAISIWSAWQRSLAAANKTKMVRFFFFIPCPHILADSHAAKPGGAGTAFLGRCEAHFQILQSCILNRKVSSSQNLGQRCDKRSPGTESGEISIQTQKMPRKGKKRWAGAHRLTRFPRVYYLKEYNGNVTGTFLMRLCLVREWTDRKRVRIHSKH